MVKNNVNRGAQNLCSFSLQTALCKQAERPVRCDKQVDI